MHNSLLLTTLVGWLTASVNGLPTISTHGSKFFTSDGDQWFIKGIAYQLSDQDPLLDTAQCQRDADLMQKLGANVIRSYRVSPEDHSGCMSAFENAGIYLFVDLDNPTVKSEINETNPMWTESQYDAYKAVMDEFQQYDNTAGFFIGNEVVTNGTHSEAAVFVKAATRDLKAYRTSKGYRDIPIGYSHADVSVLRPNLQNYLACGGNASESIDFFGLNAYEWCGPNTYEGSNYEFLTSQVMQYPIPIFISETGCITVPPRTFEDQGAVFGPNMTPYWSGAIVYEWVQAANHYGLISYETDTNALITRTSGSFSTSGTPRPVTPDFSNLMTAWAAATPSGTPLTAYTPSNPTPACPAYTFSDWEVDGNVALATLGESYDQAVQYSITAGRFPPVATPMDALFTGVFDLLPAPSGDLYSTSPIVPSDSLTSSTSSTVLLTLMSSLSHVSSPFTGHAGTAVTTGASASSSHNSAERISTRPTAMMTGNGIFGVLAALGCVMLGFVWLL